MRTTRPLSQITKGFLSLQHRVAELSGGAVHSKQALSRESWIANHGLAFQFKEQLVRMAAVLGPLLAGPVGDLLIRFKG